MTQKLIKDLYTLIIRFQHFHNSINFSLLIYYQTHAISFFFQYIHSKFKYIFTFYNIIYYLCIILVAKKYENNIDKFLQ